MATGAAVDEWLIVWSGGGVTDALPEIAQATGVTDLARAEDDSGILPRSPIFVRPDLALDERLCQFVHRSKFRSLSQATRYSYALDLRLLFSFLWQNHVDWSEATAEDIEAYEHWRRRHRDNPSPVTGAKWARERAAIQLLYDWASDRGLVARNPAASLAKPRDVRSSRVRWLTPRALKTWRRVGLLGYRADGLRDAAWDSAVDDRNAAMADLLYASGLRIQEAGSLFTIELPDVVGALTPRMSGSFVASACTKGFRRRQFWITGSALAGIEAYRSTSRRFAVMEANRAGRYERITGRRVVVRHSVATGVLTFEDPAGTVGKVNLDSLPPASRARYFVRTPDGLDPLSLWVDAYGRPIGYRHWSENVFPTANRRCEEQGVPLRCTPHMLRHSFALRMLVALEYALSSRVGMTPEERRREDLLLGSPFDLVRDLLGHASTSTTRKHYLEPLAGLRVEHLLGDEDEDDLRLIIARIASRSPLVQDLPEERDRDI